MWFTEARFGLFVHFGLYALAARHEWVKQRERLTDADYQRYFDNFRADRFEPAAWARDAKAAGMRYAVLTTKHHDGFCLWDSALTEYKSTNTPAKRDLVAEFVAAFRADDVDNTGRDMSRYVDHLHGQVRELLTAHQPDVLWLDFSYADDHRVTVGKGAADWHAEELVAMVRSVSRTR